MALLKYILKKMLMLLPVLVGISIIAFALGIMSPGDPVDQVLNPNGNESYTQAEYDAMAAKMGLDQPAVVQYFNVHLRFIAQLRVFQQRDLGLAVLDLAMQHLLQGFLKGHAHHIQEFPGIQFF